MENCFEIRDITDILHPLGPGCQANEFLRYLRVFILMFLERGKIMHDN